MPGLIESILKGILIGLVITSLTWSTGYWFGRGIADAGGLVRIDVRDQ